MDQEDGLEEKKEFFLNVFLCLMGNWVRGIWESLAYQERHFNPQVTHWFPTWDWKSFIDPEYHQNTF